VSIRKISNKRLSRNLKTKKAPLRVLPLATFYTKHRLRQKTRKQTLHDTIAKQFPSSPVQCSLENFSGINEKHRKKSGMKRPLTIKPFLNFHGTMTTLRWILLLIVIYLVAGTVAMMIQDGAESLKNIVIYSIMGFFTFFMGYLGWILARDVLVIVAGKKISHNEVEMET